MSAQSFARAFTLIELLIVVAIIAILAAIAVPNFLEAQTRSKVSRTQADFRTMATGLEAYRVDYLHYPPDRDTMGNAIPNGFSLNYLTTPVAFISSIAEDRFFDTKLFPTEKPRYWYQGEGFQNNPTVKARAIFGFRGRWIVSSHGPDKTCDFGEAAIVAGEVPWISSYSGVTVIRTYPNMLYDPTNGTISSGDLVRWGP